MSNYRGDIGALVLVLGLGVLMFAISLANVNQNLNDIADAIRESSVCVQEG